MTIDSSVKIHATAIIEPGAVLGAGSSVGPYSVIGPRVVMGKNNWVGPHVVIEGNTRIGDDNRFFQFASVGAVPQDLKFKGEDSVLEIGNGNIVREYVTLQPGTEGGGMITSIGNENLFMACAHVGHDGRIGNGNWFANGIALAGHVIVEDNVVLGGLSGVHQFVRLGRNCMLGAGSMIHKDIPPFCLGQGDRVGLAGINQIGLERKGYSKDEVAGIKQLYRKLFYGNGKFSERLEQLFNDYVLNNKDDKQQSSARQFLEFVRGSERGIAMPRRQMTE